MSFKGRLLLIILSFSTSACLLTREDVKTAEERKRLVGDVTTIRKFNADTQVRFDEIQNEQRSLKGRIETIEQQNQSKAESEKTGLSSQEDRNKIYEETLKILEEKNKKTELELAQLRLELNNLKRAKVSTSKGKRSGGNFTGAERAFSKKKWREAIVGYEKYRELNPKGKRYGVSTYKIGVCFQELGMKAEAKVFFEEVVSKFSKSKEYKKAKFRLSKLK